MLLLRGDQLRLATVRSVEALERWREHQAKMRKLKAKAAGKAGERWAVSISQTGEQLYDKSPAFRSRFKKYQRDDQPAVKARRELFLGIYDSKAKAIKSYEDMNVKEAIRSHQIVSRMPDKNIRKRPGDIYFVETVGAPPNRALEKALSESKATDEGTPGFLWDGENYLLKVCAFVRNHKEQR